MKKICCIALAMVILPGMLFAQGRPIVIYQPEMVDFDNTQLVAKVYDAITAAVMDCGWEVRTNDWAQQTGNSTEIVLQEQEIRQILWAIYVEGKRKFPNPEEEAKLKSILQAFDPQVFVIGSLVYNNSQEDRRYELTLYFFNSANFLKELPPEALYFNKYEIEEQGVVKQKVQAYLKKYHYDTGCLDQGILLKDVRIGISHLIRLERILPNDPAIANEVQYLRSYHNGNLLYHRQRYDVLTLEEEAIFCGKKRTSKANLIELEKEIIQVLHELKELDPPGKAILSSFLRKHEKRLYELQSKNS